MIELLCVLLHLFLVSSPSTLYDWEVYDIEAQNQQQVDAIEADEPLHDLIVETFTPDAERIWIIDTMGD